MASKGSKILKKAVEKVIISDALNTKIPAGKALPGPPLGPELGQRGINIAAFCKDFNNRTEAYTENIPLPCKVKVNPDRSYDLAIDHPASSYLLMQAAGINKEANNEDEIVGKTTIKHIYEIAKIKLQDRKYTLTSEKEMVEKLVATAQKIGIEVVRELDPKEYGKFLEKRKVIIEQEFEEMRLKAEAKLLRK